MRIFDPHIHMTSRTTDDYERMAAAGVRALVEPAFWLGQPRTSVGSFVDYFDALVGWEPFRAGQFGILHHATIALNPKEANDPRCREVLDVLPRYLEKDGVVAVGEIGYDSMTPEEDEVFAAQLSLAREHELPALVHTPHRDKARGTERTLAVVRESGIDPGRVAVDHLNEVTVATVVDSGCWMGFSIYPDTKMTAERMVHILREYGLERMLVNSAADWGRSDPLLTRRTGEAMLAAGFSDDDVDRVLWRNPIAFYGQSGRLDLSPANSTNTSATSTPTSTDSTDAFAERTDKLAGGTDTLADDTDTLAHSRNTSTDDTETSAHSKRKLANSTNAAADTAATSTGRTDAFADTAATSTGRTDAFADSTATFAGNSIKRGGD